MNFKPYETLINSEIIKRKKLYPKQLKMIEFYDEMIKIK